MAGENGAYIPIFPIRCVLFEYTDSYSVCVIRNWFSARKLQSISFKIPEMTSHGLSLMIH